jgi:MFS family permease
MVGYIALAEFVPMFTLAFVGGALADYVDKRKLLRVTEIGQTFLTAILIVNALLPQPSIAVLFVVVALHAGLAALQRPAFESFIQKVIPPEMMSAVMALNSIRFHIGMIIGPAVAGIIATQLSPALAYTIDLVTFAAAPGGLHARFFAGCADGQPFWIRAGSNTLSRQNCWALISSTSGDVPCLSASFIRLLPDLWRQVCRLFPAAPTLDASLTRWAKMFIGMG